MPPPPLIDLASLDLTRTIVTRSQIYELLPHRHEFMQLDGILHVDFDRQLMVAYREVRSDEWWCKGHIPGRPVFPGVLMVETAAQVASYYYSAVLKSPRFLGFSGIEGVKFRGAVLPPSRVVLVGRALEIKPRRTICQVQSFVGPTMVFEGTITGMPI